MVVPWKTRREHEGRKGRHEEHEEETRRLRREKFAEGVFPSPSVTTVATALLFLPFFFRVLRVPSYFFVEPAYAAAEAFAPKRP
jgi:hypothetical protein